MSYADAVQWMSRLVAVAGSVAAIELLWVHTAWRTGPLARRGVVFGPTGTMILVVTLLASSVALPVADTCIPAWLAAGATFALAMRFGGSYNGGSDAMLLLVLVGLALARMAPDDDLGRAGLGYVAIQLVASYFLAGIGKLRDPRWRDGTALAIVAAFPRYGVPAAMKRALDRPWLGRPLAWSHLAFELCFPLALVDMRICEVLLCAGAAFHLGNAVAFGLNRFLWTWLAAYPAVLFWAGRLHA